MTTLKGTAVEPDLHVDTFGTILKSPDYQGAQGLNFPK